MAQLIGSPNFPAAFSFKVNVAGISGLFEGSFQEVSGLESKINTESIKEGGENRFEHRLPTPPKRNNLILKRGLLVDSGLSDWARNALENFSFTTKTITVSLLSENSIPLITWVFVDSYPVSMKYSDLKAQENAIAIESFELAYSYFYKL
ncbi:MAG: phage tail protein [Flavobacteriales bacterium]